MTPVTRLPLCDLENTATDLAEAIDGIRRLARMNYLIATGLAWERDEGYAIGADGDESILVDVATALWLRSCAVARLHEQAKPPAKDSPTTPAANVVTLPPRPGA